MPRSDADQELLELQRARMTAGLAGTPSPEAVQADPNAHATWEARRQAQREAYGQFVAAAPIPIGNCLAFTTGQAVPLEHVIAYNLEELELVHRVASPELARSGKRYEDDEFRAANPHFERRQVTAPESHPAALDPRGGAAALDDERKAAAKRSSGSSASKSGGSSAKNSGE